MILNSPLKKLSTYNKILLGWVEYMMNSEETKTLRCKFNVHLNYIYFNYKLKPQIQFNKNEFCYY